MAEIDFLSSLHTRTRRDYLERLTAFPKAQAAAVAKRYGYDYWDGDRKFGYGGYQYDGRWRPVAEAMARHYALKPGDRILDVGCGKGFLLYELMQTVSGLAVYGVDCSAYAITHAKEEVRPYLVHGDAASLPFGERQFELVVSINTLHNLYCFDLERALREIERVGSRHKYLVVESYRDEEEKANLLCWVLTGECFFTPEEWAWWFRLCGYTGDHSFIFFEDATPQ